MRAFLICLACGVASGVVYDVLYAVRSPVCLRAPGAAARAVTAACDIIYFVALAAMFVWCSATFAFPSVRPYMLAACIAGSALYVKSLHLIVAFFVKRMYNRFAEGAGRGARRRAARGKE